MADWSESTMIEAAEICTEVGLDPEEYASEIYYAVENGFDNCDIRELLYLAKNYREDLESIAEECVEEGYPSHGANYELRAKDAREFYNEQVELIYSAYDEPEPECDYEFGE